ncbi:O-antigen/teichoic acid export membrane protein [Cupriavidus gilardii J11]|uniref:O-antigen/teichoic acid export membrane protein n=1 Tax=Cupriavidus gilardii J11 TaxID=936133 RepID=A0A562B4V4_9BURK|nr:hypothetical protein [Cupriavidus gilardii]TWG80241.1 O-antigen/teichoic acid export membrane protein [Cupriavidus gilardii J11]
MDRILRGIGANAFGQGVTILTQLLTVPMFLSAWGPERYGIWLMLIAVPVYLGLADLGFTGVAVNRINMSIAAGDRRGALVCYHSALALLLAIGAAMCAVAVLAGAGLGAMIQQWTGLDRGAATLTMLMIAIQAAGYMLALLSHGVFWSAGRYAEATMWFNLFRLIEFGALALGVMVLHGGYLLLMTLLAASRVLLVIVMYLRMRTLAPWARLSLAMRSRAEVRAMLMPALALNAFPIGNALNMQGMVLCAGFVFGPAFVAYFSAMRTLSRIPYQLGQLISQALSPEIGRLYGQGDAKGLRALFRHALSASVGLASMCGVALYVAGDWICNYWTHGKIAPILPDYGWLLAAAVVNSLWHTAQVMVTATNNHARLSLVFLGANTAGLLVAVIGGKLFGTSMMSLGVLATEVLILLALLPQIQGFARSGMAGALVKG